jgi:hypothetical protein
LCSGRVHVKAEQVVQRSIPLILLFVAGCSSGPTPDAIAAAEYVRSHYSNVEMVRLETEVPEYAAVAKITDGHRVKPWDSAAACAVRVRFSWRDGNRTTHDDWVVWVTGDHKALDWSSNSNRDNWRRYVRSFAKK